jgi:predicted glycoside hydrolase/deacetylase ChbG (UPF0249 family)
MLLIVNADDLGASEVVNDEIFELMEAGVVTSATLMANGPAFDQAVHCVRRFPQCSIGVHLNLTSFAPLSGAQNLASILRHGQFARDLLTRRAVVELRRQLEEELALQVQRVLNAGIQVTHLDSHHFIHLRPVLFSTFKAIQRRFGIRRVRSPFQVIPRRRFFQGLRDRAMSFALHNVYSTSSPNGWCEFRKFYAALLDNSAPQVDCLELMVHPGSGSWNFVEETELLRRGWQRLLPSDTRLGSYHLLAA